MARAMINLANHLQWPVPVRHWRHRDGGTSAVGSPHSLLDHHVGLAAPSNAVDVPNNPRRTTARASKPRCGCRARAPCPRSGGQIRAAAAGAVVPDVAPGAARGPGGQAAIPARKGPRRRRSGEPAARDGARSRTMLTCSRALTPTQPQPAPAVPPRTYPQPPPSNLPNLLVGVLRIATWAAGGSAAILLLYFVCYHMLLRIQVAFGQPAGAVRGSYTLGLRKPFMHDTPYSRTRRRCLVSSRSRSRH